MQKSPSRGGRAALPLRRLALSFCFLVAVTGRAEESANNGWRTASPEEVGLDSEALVKMFEFVRESGVPVHSVQIVRHGRLALDACSIYRWSLILAHAGHTIAATVIFSRF